MFLIDFNHHEKEKKRVFIFLLKFHFVLRIGSRRTKRVVHYFVKHIKLMFCGSPQNLKNGMTSYKEISTERSQLEEQVDKKPS